MAALEGDQQPVNEMLAEYKVRRDFVVSRLNAMPGVECPTPAGAFYAFPDVTTTGVDCRTLASALLTEAGVAVLPGTDFGPGGEGHIRISYVRDIPTLTEGLDRMERYLKTVAKK